MVTGTGPGRGPSRLRLLSNLREPRFLPPANRRQRTKKRAQTSDDQADGERKSQTDGVNGLLFLVLFFSSLRLAYNPRLKRYSPLLTNNKKPMGMSFVQNVKDGLASVEVRVCGLSADVALGAFCLESRDKRREHMFYKSPIKTI